MRTLHRLSWVALWLSLLVSAQAAPHGPVVVVLLPGTSLSDWRGDASPTLHRLLDTGAVAVMNTRTARLPTDRVRETPESAALTLGAGSRAAGGLELTDFHPERQAVGGASCTYGQRFARRTGVQATAEDWVNDDWARVLRANQGQGYDLRPGNLGDGLRLHHLRIVAGGGRFAFPVACGSDGIVPEVVTNGRLPDPLPPCLIWDAGPDPHAADPIIADAAKAIEAAHGTLIVLSPFVSDVRFAAGERLAPVVVWGEGVPPGLLYSPSTRRAGLVTDTDFAPTITERLGAAAENSWLPAAVFGHPWEFRPAPQAAAQTARLESGAYRQSRALRALPAVAVLLAALVLGGLLGMHLSALRLLSWLPILVIFALIVSPSLPTAMFWVCGLGLALSTAFFRSPVHAAGITAGLISATLVTDMTTGDPLMRWGMLGYSAVEGARYYGLGNEAMGPLIGAALLLASYYWPARRLPQILGVLGLLGVAALLGLASAGAKAGGLLVAVASFAAFLWTIWGRRWNGAVILGILALMTFALVAVSLGDLRHHADRQTHIGQGVERIRAGGLHEALDIIARKLAVEGRLAYHSAWAVPLWTSVACLVTLARRPGGTRAKALQYGGATAILCCLAVNDAGVVAGALCGSIVVCGLNSYRPTKDRPERVD